MYGYKDLILIILILSRTNNDKIMNFHAQVIIAEQSLPYCDKIDLRTDIGLYSPISGDI